MAELPTLADLGLAHKELIDLGRMLNSKGTFGTDHARMTVRELALFIEGRYAPAQIASALRDRFPQALSKYVVETIEATEAEAYEPEPEPGPETGSLPVCQEPVTEAAPNRKAAQVDAATALATALRDLVGATAAPVDESTVRRIVDEALAAQPARRVEVKTATTQVTVEGFVNPVFDDVVRLASAGENVLLVGPAGCGKSYLMQQVAKALGRSFGSVSGSAGVTESDLTGYLFPTGDGGKFEYVATDFVVQYSSENGAFGFDELDGFDANCLLSINSATANGGFHIAKRRASGLDTYVERKNCLLMATANTWGTGADTIYTGRSHLDASTLDRWYTVQMDYDLAFERALAETQSEKAFVSWVHNVRERANSAKLRRVVSTRMIQKGMTALRVGFSGDRAREDALRAWTADERAKVGA